MTDECECNPSFIRMPIRCLVTFFAKQSGARRNHACNEVGCKIITKTMPLVSGDGDNREGEEIHKLTIH